MLSHFKRFEAVVDSVKTWFSGNSTKTTRITSPSVYHWDSSADRTITNKKILIIGGTSGLGLAIAHKLKKTINHITITGTKRSKFVPQFDCQQINILDDDPFPLCSTNYDYIFCCAGSSKPGLINDLKTSDYRAQMDINYLGPIKCLYHFKQHNKKPFKFVFVSSTVAFFTFPGYSAYAPSKTALKSFFDSSFLEFKRENIELYIYYPKTMHTAGLANENMIKPEYTQFIEGNNGLSPETAADLLLDGMSYDNEICSDRLTGVFKVKSDVRNPFDIFYLILSIFVYPISCMYCAYHFRKRHPNVKND